MMQLISAARRLHEVDDARIVVTGVSAGAFMATALAANYPDVFAGFTIQAVGPYGCAQGLLEGIACMSGQDKSPAEWLDAVLLGNGYQEQEHQVWPKALLWHGEADTEVDPSNLWESVEQWTAVHGADPLVDVYETLADTEVQIYHSSDGQPVVWTFLTPDMGHAVQVDPSVGCGETDTYYADVGVCAAWESALILGLRDPDPADTASEDSDSPPDTAREADTDAHGDFDEEIGVQSACGCGSAPLTAPSLALGLVVIIGRRRRQRV